MLLKSPAKTLIMIDPVGHYWNKRGIEEGFPPLHNSSRAHKNRSTSSDNINLEITYLSPDLVKV